jgi:hypothetical protein
MKKLCIILGLLPLLFSQGLQAAHLEPVKRSVGKLQFSIDPRMELLASVHMLSTNTDLVDRGLPYSKEVLNYFSSFSQHEAVEMTERLRRFSYDAPVTFMLHLSQAPALKRQLTYSDYLLLRAGGKNNLKHYQKSLQQFAKISNFEAFWNSKIAFYNQILDATLNSLGGMDLVKMVEDYYNETQGSYNIVITPAFDGGKGSKMPRADGKDDIYACIGTTNMQNGIPYLDTDFLAFFVLHEFGHSFVDHLKEPYVSRVAALEALFTPIKEIMTKQAYGAWGICVNEHIVRAAHIRMLELNMGPQYAKALLERDVKNGFIYLEPLVEKLKEYESQKARGHLTFTEFYPELLSELEQLLKTEYWKQALNKDFSGPINSVFISNTGVWEEKIAVICPTKDEDIEALKIAQDYAVGIFDRLFKSRGALLLFDTQALKMDLSEYNILAYGTIESNLFLKQHAASFPFRVVSQTIYADKEYSDPDLKFISCIPSPFNPKKGLLVYTAFSNKYIQDINNVNHGTEDYIIFQNRNTILHRGFYFNKSATWTFE